MELEKHGFIFFFIILGMYNAWAQDYFVSPNALSNGDGTESNPWHTIERAIFELRKIRKAKTDHVTVNLMAGTHYLSRTLWMDKKDSNMDIVAHNNADVTISGGNQANLVWEQQGDRLSVRVSNFVEIGLDFFKFYGNPNLYKLRAP